MAISIPRIPWIGTGSRNGHVGSDGYGSIGITGGDDLYSKSVFIGCQDDSCSSAMNLDGTVSSQIFYDDGMFNVSGDFNVSRSYTTAITVDGIGSTLICNDNLHVGYDGSGELNITNDAMVSVGGNTYVAYETYYSGYPLGWIHFGTMGGTLTTQSLRASEAQLTGTGTITALAR